MKIDETVPSFLFLYRKGAAASVDYYLSTFTTAPWQ